MIQYYPWSNKVLDDSLTLQKYGAIPTLDLELTSKCTGASCIYCDSKPDVCSFSQEGELDFNSLKRIIIDAKKKGLKWVYTCGLGEPLEDDKFWNFIHLLKANDIYLSMFSNGVFINDIYVAKELKNHNVNIVLKMDTFDEKSFDIILGGRGIAKNIYCARDLLIEAGYGNHEKYTDIAFSIVPTKLSLSGIPEVIDFCKKHGVFASIGELEQAGEVVRKNLNNSLGLSIEEVQNLKKIADDYFEGNYMRPICPCIITGLHIDNLGNCVVDKDTGLNCKWFLLKEPQTVKIGNVANDNIVELHQKAEAYRKKCFSENFQLIRENSDVSYLFGGCGGNPKDIIEIAIKNYC